MVTCKLGEKGCWNDGKCRLKPCSCENQVVTNADRIRAMSDELLAAQLAEVFCKGFNASTSVVIPDELVKEIMEQFLEQLKQLAEGE